jgi:hypothetical protein
MAIFEGRRGSVTPRRILVTASRTWDDERRMDEALFTLAISLGWPRHADITLVVGGAPGGDAIAAKIAKWRSWEVETHRAHWRTDGKAAGVIRNLAMVDAGADRCEAFIRCGSRGATHCADAAERFGIPTRRHLDATVPAEPRVRT